MDVFQENPGYTCILDFPLGVLLVSKLKSDISTFHRKKIMLVSVLYQLLLVIVDRILLGRFKLGDEVLDQSGMGAIFLGHGADGDFILDDSH